MNCDHNIYTTIDPPRPSKKKGTINLLIQFIYIYFIQTCWLLNSTFIETLDSSERNFEMWIFTSAICNLHPGVNLGLYCHLSAIINRRLCMTSALTFFLMIFFSNSGKPLMKFSFTNSSPSTSWSFLNPSAQKKNELIFKTWYFPWG